MSNNKSEFDATVVVGLMVVFALPLTLLVPGFSVWDVVPKFRVVRCPLIAQHLSWPQLNAAIITILVLFFCLYLEVRKRKLDDMVENVLAVSQATDKAMEAERERQTAAMHVCLELLDASGEHYEQLVLLRDDLRMRSNKHQPPAIELSASDI